MDSKELRFSDGLQHGTPIALGYLSVSFSFGIAAVADGISWWQAVLISLTNLTSSGQFAGIGIIAASGSYFEMMLTQLVINLRYALMSISLSQKLSPDFSLGYRLTLGHVNTDEIFAVAMSRPEEINPRYLFGLALLPYIGWSSGTLIGALCGNILPAAITQALSVMIYGMFIAIIVPAMKQDRPTMAVVFLAILISCLIYYLPVLDFITSGFSIIICAIAASAFGAAVFPREMEAENDA